MLAPFILVNLPLFGIRLNANQSFMNIPAEEQSIGERALLVESANHIFADHALMGIGLGASPVAMKDAYPNFSVDYRPPHLTLLDAALETGIFGATFYFLLLLLPWIVLLRHRNLLARPDIEPLRLYCWQSPWLDFSIITPGCLSQAGYGNGWFGECWRRRWKRQISMNWLDLFFIPVAIIYLLVVSALFVYGINFFYLALGAWRKRKVLVGSSPAGLVTLPTVTVQLPVYNEWYVATRLIEAAAALDYPNELLRIQVLDDSTDETVSLIAETVKPLRVDGIHIDHIHRTHRHGYKAGALAQGLKQASGEFIAIFDADFVPRPDFLKRILPYFENDRVAFVSERAGPI